MDEAEERRIWKRDAAVRGLPGAAPPAGGTPAADPRRSDAAGLGGAGSEESGYLCSVGAGLVPARRRAPGARAAARAAPTAQGRGGSSQRHVQHHHEQEARHDSQGAGVGVLPQVGLGDELLHHHIHHGSGGEGQ